MNALLLAKAHANPYYINRLYVKLAGNAISGLLLDYLMKQFSLADSSKNNIITLFDTDICDNTFLFVEELTQARRKLKKLPFITIVQRSEAGKFTYSLDPVLFNRYVEELQR